MSPEPWRVVLARGAEKDIDRLDRQVRDRVVRGLRRLAEDPRAGELVNLKGRSGSRLRVGDWRVILELDEASRAIRVKRVLPRGRAYKR